MVEHTEEEALGLVLNRPSEYAIRDVWERVTGVASDCIDPVYVGGPCEGPLMAIHTLPEAGLVEVAPQLWFTSHSDHISHIVDAPSPPFRIFSGYSGWGAGQLEEEMKLGGWLIVPVKPKYVFQSDDDELWQMAAGDIGDDILMADPRIREIPNDPTLN